MSNVHFKPANLTMCLGLALFFAGCSTNNRLDDTNYRAIGNPSLKPAYTTSTRQPAAETTKQQDYPGQMSHKPSKQPKKDKHPSRFGSAETISKIIKTAEIHCHKQRYPIQTNSDSFWGPGKGGLTQCSYRFPQHCGGHLFSILDYASRSILIYRPPKQNHYIIDSVKGTPKSQPGLWDQDDHLGSNRTNAGYFFQSDYNHAPNLESFNPSGLGWIIKASHQNEREFGALYEQALQETSACF